MVEGARLESVYTVTPYRGFESLLLRHPSFSSRSSAFALRHKTEVICGFSGSCMALVVPTRSRYRVGESVGVFVNGQFDSNGGEGA